MDKFYIFWSAKNQEWRVVKPDGDYELFNHFEEARFWYLAELAKVQSA